MVLEGVFPISKVKLRKIRHKDGTETYTVTIPKPIVRMFELDKVEEVNVLVKPDERVILLEPKPTQGSRPRVLG